jgi:lipooligosaccharide transport system permease protein
MNLTPKLFRVWQRNFHVWLTYWKPSLVGIQFLAPGIISSAAMYSAVFECTFGTYTRLEPQKTFDSILMTPVMVDDITAAEILWGATKATMTAFAILIVMLAMPFDLVQSYGAIFVPLVGFLVGLMFSAIAVLYTSYAPSYDFFSYFFTHAYAFRDIFPTQ